MGNFQDLTGQKFGRLTVIERVENNKYGSAQWLCECECGTRSIVTTGNLKKSADHCQCFLPPEAQDVDELWKEIEGTEGRYFVSNMGKVKSVKRDRYLKPRVDRYGYETVVLWIGYDKKIYTTVHRLVAKAFIENPNGYNIVNHKDMNKLNNNADNLEWCTNQYNVQHWYTNDKTAAINLKECRKHSIEANKHTIRVWKHGEYIGEYKSKHECAVALNISEKTIYNWIRRDGESQQGYRFELVENPEFTNNKYKENILRKRG